MTRPNGVMARFKSVKPNPERARGLDPAHPAVIEGRTLFPGQVTATDQSQRFLISGQNNSKIGRAVTKGPWSGMPIYTLTLEERATCPRTCEQWLNCYGNSMQWPKRWDHQDPDFLPALAAEVVTVGRQHPAGFVVRLHVLGDFFSPRYVLFWASLLELAPSLHIYGYTARLTTDDDAESARIARALDVLTTNMWSRFAVRTSSSDPSSARSRSIVVDADPQLPGVVICPAQTGGTETCGTCGLCWAESARDLTIAFLRHGMSPRVAEPAPVEAPRPAMVAQSAPPTPPTTGSLDTGARDAAVLAAIKEAVGADGWATITFAQIGKAAGVPTGSVSFSVYRLEAAGQVTLRRNGPQQAMSYRMGSAPPRASELVAVPEPVAAAVVASVTPGAKTIQPPREVAPRGRQVPRGARFENLGGGVQVIRMKTVTPQIVARARDWIARGMEIDELADMFDVSPESLERKLGEEGVKL